MKPSPHAQLLARPLLVKLCVAVAGAVLSALAILLVMDATGHAALARIGGPILAVSLMGAGMIAAAAVGSLRVGIALALLTGAGLVLAAHVLGMLPLPHPLSTGFAVTIASISFAARGALFARSASEKGWWIAVFVVAGEAAMLATAVALPNSLPDWLLALLPAQWASMAIQTALSGTGTCAASSALFALAGTAAATLLVAWLWPRRWPYLLMFTTWLGLSALVWYQPAPPVNHADPATADAPSGQIGAVTAQASLLSVAATLAFGITPAQAQTPQADNEIVVSAKRSGAPMWTIDTPTGTVLLVGEIRAVPKSTPWEPERLRDATLEANRVILRAEPKFSPGDVLRLIFRGGSFTKLPDRRMAADYLTVQQRARLAALETRYKVDYDRGSFLMSSFDLLARRLDFDSNTTDDATEIVQKAAKRANIPIVRPERFRGEDLLDNLAAAVPESHIPCLEAAMVATEAGQAIIEARGNDWRRFDVAAVMANPLEIALSTCWPWADEDLGGEIRDQWTQLISEASASEGVTLAVVPLGVLAERQGVLDQLEARGFVIAGPNWP